MENKSNGVGHVLAMIVILVWGITFVSTKVLLADLAPFHIMVTRFTIAYLSLLVFYPRELKFNGIKNELPFIFAGLTGVLGYFLLENTAVKFTTVGNVGLILSAAPMFVALALHFFTEDEKFQATFFYGFVMAMLGVFIVMFNGRFNININPLGDILALLAGFMWSMYSLILKRVQGRYKSIFVTRRTFFYGVIMGWPVALILEGPLPMEAFTMVNIGHFLFLGVGASAICFVLWNQAIRRIGGVKTSSYIYAMPLITLLAGMILLDEEMTLLMALGAGLIITGVYISEKQRRQKVGQRINETH